MQIVTPEQQLPVRNNLVVIFGDIGIGKTSLCFTVKDRPLMLFDFEKGVGRAVMRGTTAAPKDWAEVQTWIRGGNLEAYRNGVIAIDTGKALLDDFMADAVIKLDPKTYGLNAGGLSLKGYGVLKEVFKVFMTDLSRYNIDIVVICHEKEFVKKNESPKMVPSMTGGSYDILMARADLVGYFTSKGDRRTLEFDPTDVHAGKNCVRLPLLNIPNYTDTDYPNYMGDILQKLKDKFTEQTESQKEIGAFIEGANLVFSGVKVETLAAISATVMGTAKTSVQQQQAAQIITQRTREMLQFALAVGEANETKFNQVLEICNALPVGEANITQIKTVIWRLAKQSDFNYNKDKAIFEPNIKPVTNGI